MEVNKIIEGDCIEKLKELPDNSVDAIVTDPPYGLGFMGKHWDTFDKSQFGIKGEEGENDLKVKKNFNVLPRYNTDGLYAFTLDWAKECLRVLKPGGHLLSFAGTRTYHKIAMAIEDVGFEIRDQMQWLYGSGFPKSMNVGKVFDKKPELLYTKKFKEWLEDQISKSSKTKQQINDECGFTATSYTKTDGKDYWSSCFPSKDKWNKMKEVIGLSDEFDFVIRDNIDERGTIEPTGNLHKGSGDNIQFSGKQLADNPISEYAKEWDGWGTALKPANEPIVVARKPLSEKTITLNVLKWGTGALNIDDCRIGTEVENVAVGRFPANVILTHHPDCIETEDYVLSKGQKGGNRTKTFGDENDGVAGGEGTGGAMDEPDTLIKKWNCHPDCPVRILNNQSGVTKQGHWAKTKVTGFGDFGNGSSEYTGVGKKDKEKGGASRFFYCAKASKKERNQGLDDFDGKPITIQQPHNSKTLEERYQMVSKNNHPTVKPVKLMQYLVRLVTPKFGVVLDPFLGSGTTAMACIKENLNYIGIEREPDYIKIAKARIRSVENE